MVSLTKRGNVGGQPTTARRSLGSHYFLGRPSTGFSGRGFLEHGLQIGVSFAQDEFARFIKDELTEAQGAAFRGYADSPLAAKAGVNLSVFENVSTGAVGVNVRSAMFKAFRGAVRPAKTAAVAHYNRTSNKRSGIDHPSRYGDRVGSVPASFHYKVSGGNRGRGTVSLGVQLRGNRNQRAKVVAQNFGLKPGTIAGAKRFKLGGGIT